MLAQPEHCTSRKLDISFTSPANSQLKSGTTDECSAASSHPNHYDFYRIRAFVYPAYLLISRDKQEH